MELELALKNVITFLLEERNEKRDLDVYSQEELLALWRALVNIRQAGLQIPEDIMIQWEKLLKLLRESKGIVSLKEAIARQVAHVKNTAISLWRGDITRLAIDGIVNAANSQFQGCFVPGHHCIDNAIQTFAGPKLRDDCAKHIQKQGYLEPLGMCTLTKGYMLPAQYVLHTVGPNTAGRSYTEADVNMLRKSYEAILKKATEHNLSSIAICSISTGVFGFPIEVAAPLVKETICNWLENHKTTLKHIILNLFSNDDYMLYQSIW